jgi:hypothetical protein
VSGITKSAFLVLASYSRLVMMKRASVLATIGSAHYAGEGIGVASQLIGVISGSWKKVKEISLRD